MKIVRESLTPIFESPDMIPKDLQYLATGEPLFMLDDFLSDEDNDKKLLAHYDNIDAHPFWVEDGNIEIKLARKYHLEYVRRLPNSYSGRLWKDSKIISFWQYPDVKTFNWIITELSRLLSHYYKEKIDIYNDGWLVEVIPFDKWHNDDEAFTSELVSVNDYKGSSQRNPKDLEQEHNISPLLKQKKFRKGWGSDSKRYRDNRIWNMAAPIGESKIK